MADEVAGARAKKPTGPVAESDLALLRAAVQQQGQLLGQVLDMLAVLTRQVSEIRHHIGVEG